MEILCVDFFVYEFKEVFFFLSIGFFYNEEEIIMNKYGDVYEK